MESALVAFSPFISVFYLLIYSSLLILLNTEESKTAVPQSQPPYDPMLKYTTIKEKLTLPQPGSFLFAHS